MVGYGYSCSKFLVHMASTGDCKLNGDGAGDG